jgi:hypothetical protein
MSNEPLYKNLESLDPIKKILTEASEGLSGSTRTIDTSSMKEVLGAAAGAGIGGAVSFAALYFAGTVGVSAVGITTALATAGALVGGGMAAGILVLAAPVALLGVGGYALIARRNQKRLVQAKEELLRQAIAKRDAVMRALENRVNDSEQRAKYLESLNTLLRGVINDLQQDLAT